MTRSIISTLSVSGKKPAPNPSIRCGPGRPPDKTAQEAGSTATTSTEGLRARRPSATPVKVPPVPTPITTMSTGGSDPGQRNTHIAAGRFGDDPAWAQEALCLGFADHL